MVLSLLVSGAAAWWRNITGILDVTAPPYSADNTGSVDVSAALQAAIDFARLNGTVVFLPLGVYRITQQVNISMATRSAGVVIEGQVPTTTIVTGSAPTSPREHQRPVLYVPPARFPPALFLIGANSSAKLHALATRDSGGMGNRDPRGWSVVHCELPDGGNLTTPPLERPILFQTELLR